MTFRTLKTRVCFVALAASMFLIITGGAAAQDGPIKIAVVDLERVVALSNSGKALQAKLEQFQRDVQAQAEKQKSDMEGLRQRISEGTNSLSEDKLAEMQKQYEDMGIGLRRLRDDKQREGQKIQAEGLKEIEGVLEPVFKKIQEEQGYDLILNYAPGVVVMASAKVDITDSVVALVNAAQGS